MNNRPECIPCLLRRVLHTADRATTDDWLHRKILGEVMSELERVDDVATPAELIHLISRRASKTLGIPDPYGEEKRKWLEETTGNAEWIESVVDSAKDSFEAALRLSAAANLLDCEFRQELVPNFSLKSLVQGYEKVPFAADNVDDLRAAVERAERVIFVHATAGELFFDQLLIRAFKMQPESIYSVVREAPILAHATAADAKAVGLDKVATIVTPGIDCLGLPLNACSEEFREVYRRADVVIAKGQPCLETLEGPESRLGDTDIEVYFLLRAKCSLVARHLGVAVGDAVLEAD